MPNNLIDQIPWIGSTRRNHGLEHATLNILAKKFQQTNMAGISDSQGFLLITDLPTEIVTDAVLEAEQRLKSGESELAIHPHCGTNLVVPFTAAALMSWLTLIITGSTKRPRLPQVLLSVLSAVSVFFLAKPLGPYAQKKLTTCADPGKMRVKQVTSQKIRDIFVHRISTGR